MTASGCGVAIKEYQQLLANEPDYAEKAKVISQLYKEPAELITTAINANPATIATSPAATYKDKNIAFHPPCTLQHGMQLKNLIEPILQQLGLKLVPFQDTHLCCGSAGTYSITQKNISQQLLTNKLNNIHQAQPDIIATANIGCQLHLQSGTAIPVKHWLELLI